MILILNENINENHWKSISKTFKRKIDGPFFSNKNDFSVKSDSFSYGFYYEGHQVVGIESRMLEENG